MKLFTPQKGPVHLYTNLKHSPLKQTGGGKFHLTDFWGERFFGVSVYKSPIFISVWSISLRTGVQRPGRPFNTK